MNTEILSMHMFLSDTGFTGRNTEFIDGLSYKGDMSTHFVWLRPMHM